MGVAACAAATQAWGHVVPPLGLAGCHRRAPPRPVLLLGVREGARGERNLELQRATAVAAATAARRCAWPSSRHRRSNGASERLAVGFCASACGVSNLQVAGALRQPVPPTRGHGPMRFGLCRWRDLQRSRRQGTAGLLPNRRE